MIILVFIIGWLVVILMICFVIDDGFGFKVKFVIDCVLVIIVKLIILFVNFCEVVIVVYWLGVKFEIRNFFVGLDIIEMIVVLVWLNIWIFVVGSCFLLIWLMIKFEIFLGLEVSMRVVFVVWLGFKIMVLELFLKFCVFVVIVKEFVGKFFRINVLFWLDVVFFINSLVFELIIDIMFLGRFVSVCLLMICFVNVVGEGLSGINVEVFWFLRIWILIVFVWNLGVVVLRM